MYQGLGNILKQKTQDGVQMEIKFLKKVYYIQ